MEDKTGTIWIGTNNGLVKLIKQGNPEDYQFVTYTQNQPDSINFVDNYISSLIIDNENRIWLGSYKGGLFQFLPKQEKFISYSPPLLDSSIFKNEIHVVSLYQDQHNTLWVGTESNGLLQFDINKRSYQSHPKNDFLLSNMIMGMLEDDMESLWIGTSRGLSNYSPWNNKLSTYTYIDGLESSGFNRNSVLKSTGGKMYFGSNSALSYFYPLEVSNNPFKPNVVITDFKVLNKSE